MSKHTPGPWAVHSSYPWIIKQDADVPFCEPDSGLTICNTMGHSNSGFFPTPEEGRANARLIAAAPELLEVMRDVVGALWVVDSHQVEFDSTVAFGKGYDFSSLDGHGREEFLAEHSCVVWGRAGKWSAYCTYDGSMWFERFATADAAKEACMALLDKVMPDHPGMKARAAIAKAEGKP